MGFAFQQHLKVLDRIKSLVADEFVATTIITFGEDLSGWLPACRRASDGTSRAKAYARLLRGFEFYQKFSCLPFDDAAANIFEQLKSQKIRTGTNDLSIAAITLSVNGVLVTRNTKDYQQVPNLIIEDWTV